MRSHRWRGWGEPRTVPGWLDWISELDQTWMEEKKSPSQQLADLSLFMQQYPLSLWIQFCHTLRCRPRKENFISLLYFYKNFQKKEKNIISVSLIKLQMAQAEDIKTTSTERNWTIDFCLLPPKLFRLFSIQERATTLAKITSESTAKCRGISTSFSSFLLFSFSFLYNFMFRLHTAMLSPLALKKSFYFHSTWLSLACVSWGRCLSLLYFVQWLLDTTTEEGEIHNEEK